MQAAAGVPMAAAIKEVPAISIWTTMASFANVTVHGCSALEMEAVSHRASKQKFSSTA
jgi:hypothetical protein